MEVSDKSEEETSNLAIDTSESSKKITKTIELQSENLSEYEKIREKNIQERKEMFNQMKIASNNATKSIKPVRKISKRKPKRNNTFEHEIITRKRIKPNPSTIPMSLNVELVEANKIHNGIKNDDQETSNQAEKKKIHIGKFCEKTFNGK